MPGWLGIALLIRAYFISNQSFPILRGWGATLLGCSLWLFVIKSEAMQFTIMTAIPFHFAWGYAALTGFRPPLRNLTRVLTERPTAVLFAVGLFALEALIRLPGVLNMAFASGQARRDWLLTLLPLLYFSADLLLIYVIWHGRNWARWSYLALSLWGWGQFFWYTGTTPLAVFPQNLRIGAQLLATSIAFVLLYRSPGSDWFRTIVQPQESPSH